jgi:hypothetical protein
MHIERPAMKRVSIPDSSDLQHIFGPSGLDIL